ncbi:MAG TPA: hypothetical protein VL492_12045 [Methylovirgula sp.]|nr:hypothetical protein [Methylovirgula sp.]
MRRGLYLTAAAGLFAFMASAALAAPVAPIAATQDMLPLHQVSVFCGQNGCQPITKMRRCTINSHQNEQQNQQNGSIRRLTNCNS